MPVVTRERAATRVALPDGVLDPRRNVARIAAVPVRRARAIRGSEPAPLELAHQKLERTVQDGDGIALWRGVTREVLRVPQQVRHLARDAQVQLIAIAGDRDEFARGGRATRSGA